MFKRKNITYTRENMINTRENIMYTCENIPVTTIYVSRIPNKVKSRDLLRQFGYFGKIVDCFFKQFRITGRGSYALITYDNSLEASKAIRGTVVIKGVLLKASTADFWHQKNTKIGDMFKSVLPSSDIATVNEYVDIQDENNILNVVNEYCFMKIFSYLPLKQLIQSERVSKRWKYLVREKYKGIVELKSMEWGLTLRTVKLHLLLFKIGRYLKTLHLNIEFNEYINRTLYVVAKLCPNLNELSVVNLQSYHWSYLLRKCSNLKSLHLRRCGVHNNIFRLREPVIMDKHSSRDFFAHLNNLTKLSLINSDLQHILSIEVCVYMSNLKELHLEGASLKKSYISNVLKLFPQLESLCLSNYGLSSELELIVDMKKLKTLKLCSDAAVNDELLMKICSNCTELTNLDLSNDSQITEITEKTLSCIWSLKNLKVLCMNGITICGMSFENFAMSRIHSDYIRKYRICDLNTLKYYVCNNFRHVCVNSRRVLCKHSDFLVKMYFCDCFSIKSFLLA